MKFELRWFLAPATTPFDDTSKPNALRDRWGDISAKHGRGDIPTLRTSPPPPPCTDVRTDVYLYFRPKTDAALDRCDGGDKLRDFGVKFRGGGEEDNENGGGAGGGPKVEVKVLERREGGGAEMYNKTEDLTLGEARRLLNRRFDLGLAEVDSEGDDPNYDAVLVPIRKRIWKAKVKQRDSRGKKVGKKVTVEYDELDMLPTRTNVPYSDLAVDGDGNGEGSDGTDAAVTVNSLNVENQAAWVTHEWMGTSDNRRRLRESPSRGLGEKGDGSASPPVIFRGGYPTLVHWFVSERFDEAPKAETAEATSSSSESRLKSGGAVGDDGEVGGCPSGGASDESMPSLNQADNVGVDASGGARSRGEVDVAEERPGQKQMRQVETGRDVANATATYPRLENSNSVPVSSSVDNNRDDGGDCRCNSLLPECGRRWLRSVFGHSDKGAVHWQK